MELQRGKDFRESLHDMGKIIKILEKD